MATWKRYVRLFKPDVRAEIEEELRFHLEARIAEYEARGYTRADAERLARERFGDAERVRRALEAHDAARQRREQRREYMSHLAQDVRVSLRGLRRTPGFALAVLATVAIGIGANTAVFSVVSRELIDPLPYRDADRLVLLYSSSAETSRGFVSPNEIARLQQSSRTLFSVAAFGSYAGYTYVGERETVPWQGVSVGPGFFRTLGVTPLIGRLIDDRDVEPGAPKVIVLNYEIWQQNFGGDPSVIGRTISMSEATWTVIGVTRPDFVPPARRPQIWTPLDVQRFLGTRAADAYMLQAVGRLADEATLPQVESEIRVLAHAATPAESTIADPFTLTAIPIRDAMVGDVRPILLVVMGAALLVLALACVNLAGLFLSRATARSRELAVRAALGAGRWRIVRQLVTETSLLAIAGGALGILFAFWAKGALLHLGGRVVPPTGTPPAIDGGVLAFALVISLCVGIVAGLVPALFGARGDLNATLGESSRGSAGGRVAARLGRVLVAGQMALAVLLLIGAGLLGRTLFALQHEDLGYDASHHVLSTIVSLPRSYGTSEAQVQFFTDLLARIRSVPGAQAAGAIGIAPWNGWNHTGVRLDRGPAGAAGSINVPLGRVSDGYFAAVGTRVIAGRAFQSSDRTGALPVAIVSERLARLAWPGRSAIGQRLQIDDVDTAWRTVVGVVEDVRESASSELEATVYASAWQTPQRWYEVLVRSDGDAASLLPAVRRELRAMDPTLPAMGPRTLDEMLSVSLTGQRLPVLFTAAFAVLALVLAVLGMYGVVAYAVTLRTRELGIRAALGGSRADIIRLVLRDGLTTAVVGTAIGAAIAIAGARLIAGLLYGVTAHDPATFVAAATVLLVASAAACLVPAVRATRINPVEALRTE